MDSAQARASRVSSTRESNGYEAAEQLTGADAGSG